MTEIDKILLKLFFPQFPSPSSSRFESLFIDLNKYNTMKSISYIISPETVIQGTDKRTSLIIKNIPKNIKKKEIRNLVQKYGNINFLAICPDSNFSDLLTAYLNVINYKSVVPIFMGLRKHSFTYCNNKYNIEINYSHVQGKEGLKKFFNVNYTDNESKK